MAIELKPLQIDRLMTTPVQVDMLRLDLIHPFVSGNKFFKLILNIEAAKQQGAELIISFGGAYSNHLHALAWAAHEAGIPSMGLVRGEAVENPTLHDCKQWGMALRFISRSNYQQKREAVFLEALHSQYPKAYIIPEGGDNELGLRGCEDILLGIDMLRYQHLVCAVGTGTTFAGLVRRMPETCMAWGVPVFKHHDPILASLREKIPHQRWGWLGGYEDGGFGKYSVDLQQKVAGWELEWGIELDRVYTAKMVWAVMGSIEKGVFKLGERVLMVHTGGLQGNRSLQKIGFPAEVSRRGL